MSEYREQFREFYQHQHGDEAEPIADKTLDWLDLWSAIPKR